MSVTPAQVRAARAWLNWNQAELAEHASVGLSTLRDFEADRRTPIPNNLAAIQRALEDAGISFQFGDRGEARGITGVMAPSGSSPTRRTPEAQSEKRQGTADRGQRGKRTRR